MEILSALEGLKTELENTYEAIELQGGEVPTHRNVENMVDAIRSIPEEES